jgi:hypothetical protein
VEEEREDKAGDEADPSSDDPRDDIESSPSEDREWSEALLALECDLERECDVTETEGDPEVEGEIPWIRAAASACTAGSIVSIVLLMVRESLCSKTARG